jgi:hypothetical protein
MLVAFEASTIIYLWSGTRPYRQSLFESNRSQIVRPERWVGAQAPPTAARSTAEVGTEFSGCPLGPIGSEKTARGIGADGTAA